MSASRAPGSVCSPVPISPRALRAPPLPPDRYRPLLARARAWDIVCRSEQRATPHGEVDRAEVAGEAVHLYHNADDPVLRHGAQSATRRDALAFELSAGAGGGQRERWWVLLGDFGEEHISGVLAKAGRPAQGRALGEFWEGGDPDCFECCAFAVADVLQLA